MFNKRLSITGNGLEKYEYIYCKKNYDDETSTTCDNNAGDIDKL